MDELITRITGRHGIDEGTAREAVSIVLSFLAQHGDSAHVKALITAIPGAAAIVDPVEDGSPSILAGGLGGLMGGGVMEVVGKLQGLGLGMGQMQALAKETIGFAREKAGAETVDAVVQSIPGLSQFV